MFQTSNDRADVHFPGGYGLFVVQDDQRSFSKAFAILKRLCIPQKRLTSGYFVEYVNHDFDDV